MEATKPIVKQTPNSSQIREFWYEPDTKKLFVTFKTGRTYVYMDVSKEAADGAYKAESIGKYLNSAIKLTHSYRAL